jgi:omega-hydroxy-beta-dihydromenaquinone-9 sulfotransferase
MSSHSTTVSQPLFVIGTGRCGLTPVMDLLTVHRDLAWPSQYNRRFPDRPAISLLSRMVDHRPLASHRLGWRLPVHDEAYPFWDGLFGGFAEPDRDLVASDVTPYVAEQLRSGVAGIQRYQGKPRFIAEYSGWSRIGFMRAVFPDARFVHVIRDGRAVANSFLNVSWWAGYRGVHRWQFGLPDAEETELLERFGDSFVARAGIHWRRLVRNIDAAAAQLDDSSYRVVRYEDLVREPVATTLETMAWAALATDDAVLARRMSKVPIVDANTTRFRIPSWRENLTAEQIAMLDVILERELAQFGYADRPAVPAAS